MIRSSLFPRERARQRRAAFTLIELLTVIAIILVLAGLLLHVAGSANERSSRARAQSEIQAISTALESYKADNGTYPRPSYVGPATTPISSDKLDAQATVDNDPGGSDAGLYKTAGALLYQAVSGFPATGTTYTRRYMELKPGQLSSNTAAPTNTTYIIDPFGICYGYSTAGTFQIEKAQSATPPTAPPSTIGYNPTFDLWSSGGYGTGGKSYGSSGLAATAYNTLWVKNW